MMNLKFKKSYTFIHTSSNSKRDRQRGRERKRKKSKSKTSLANPLLIWKTTITKTHDRSIIGLHDHHDQNPWLIHHRSPWLKLHWSHGCLTHTHTHPNKSHGWKCVSSPRSHLQHNQRQCLPLSPNLSPLKPQALSLMLTITRGGASLPSSLHFAPNHLQLDNFSLKTFPLFLIYTEPMTSSFSPSPSLYSKPTPYPWWNLCLVFVVIYRHLICIIFNFK